MIDFVCQVFETVKHKSFAVIMIFHNLDDSITETSSAIMLI